MPSSNSHPRVRKKSAPRPTPLKTELLGRLGRAEGQLRGLQRMIGDGAYCIDVLQQVSAARRALDRIALILIRDHLESCVSEAMAHHRSEGKVRELIDTLDRFLA
ncbi:MAG: transcriptional regulator [Candidatus Binatus sp.]|jgi:DNA-binding FrmR family transcriptional regulator|nr:transcriptional regulator [Candidatus Binatus sp.]